MAIRPLQPFDVTRYALLGGPGSGNRAYTMDSLGRETQPRLAVIDAARLSLTLPTKNTRAFTWTRGRQVAGITAARPRSGSQSWEIAHLLVPPDESLACDELLRSVCLEVARNRGQRVFIRLRHDDPLVEVAGGCGFVKYSHELLFQGKGQQPPNGKTISVRKKVGADEYGLFRLYTAYAPLVARMANGVTFDHWSSSRERSRGRSREFIYEREGAIRGWLRIIRQIGASQLFVMVHPEHQTRTANLTDYGLEQLTGNTKVHCLVPDYDVLLQRLLMHRGYEPTAEYVTLVRSMVARVVKAKAHRAVTMASI